MDGWMDVCKSLYLAIQNVFLAIANLYPTILTLQLAIANVYLVLLKKMLQLHLFFLSFFIILWRKQASTR